jgi:GT2 family glycosyltransferase
MEVLVSYSHRVGGTRRGAVATWLGGIVSAACDTLLQSGLLYARSLQTRRPWLAAQLRRAVLVVWWSATWQLHTQFRFWLKARRMRRAAPRTLPLCLIEAVCAEAIAVPCAEHPVISVIIPTYGQTEFTLRCLASIAAYPPAAPIEVIVVDDAFAGEETMSLTHVRGIRLHRNTVNLGFLRACNAAAGLARGDFLLFLNNDTQVLPGWADTMVELFRARADVGAVGSKLLYPDGQLQEAGGIIWRDGSGWNFGRYNDPSHPIYNYVREVDYCSGASLMVPRALFARLQGFDESFAPAYFEDADLSFRLRSIGLKTLYQPRSVVVHYEGVSHGRDVLVGVKAYQRLNRRKFVRRWGAELAREHYSSGRHVPRARQHARNRTTVLIVDHQVPEPDRDAGSRTMLCIIRALLAEGIAVTFWPHNLLYNAGYVEALQQIGVEVLHGPLQAPFIAWMQEHGGDLDLVILSRPEVAEDCLPAVRAHSKARVVYYGHDLHFSRMRMQGTLLRDERLLRAADRMEERERAVWHGADVVLYPSEAEAEAVRSVEPSVTARALVPYCFDTFAPVRPAVSGHEILFVAGFGHSPNEDAACWFVEAVLPLVLACVPDAVLSIVGSNPTAQVRGLASNAVRVIADVSDAELKQRYQGARVAVVPLRCGAGVKLKVVEALREGLPLVTTEVGVQGLPDLANIVSVRSESAEFAAAVCALLTDDALWTQRSVTQLEFAQARFTLEALRESLLVAFDLPALTPVTLAA